jgi:predicted phage replisome organizer
MAKKYYWIRLQKGFFKSLAMKKLRRIAGGDTYTIIYLKLQLLSADTEGVLYYEGIENSFAEEVASLLDEDEDNVKVTLQFLESVGLLERKGEDEYLLTEVPFIVGSETDKAQLMRNKRAKDKQNLLESGNNVTAELPSVTECYTEKEKRREREREE